MTATADRVETMSDAKPDKKDASPPPGTQQTGSTWRLPAVLFTVAVALIAAGVIFLLRASSLDGTSATNNRALVNSSRTSEVIGQVSTALNQVLSYDYSKPQVAQAAGRRWLTGDAPKQYQLLFNQLQTASKGQQLTLVAKVSTAGVISLRGDTARLLVFIDQSSTRVGTAQPTVAAAQVEITAVHRGSRWLISELQPI